MNHDRDKFEIHAANQGLRDFERNEFDDYRNPFTQQPWCFWKASRDALVQAPAEAHELRAILVECQQFIDTTQVPAYPAGADLADRIDKLLEGLPDVQPKHTAAADLVDLRPQAQTLGQRADGSVILGYTGAQMDATMRLVETWTRSKLATQAPAPGADDMLEPLIYAAIMHNGKPKTVAEFERAAANVADMLQRRAEVTHNKPVASIYISDDGSREFDDWRVDLPPGNHQLFTAPRPDQPQPESLPHPGAPEAEEMIEKLLAEYNRPSNMKNAARAGYMAAKRLLQDARQPLPAVEDAEPIGWGGVIETCAELCDPHFIAQQDLAELKRYAGNWNSTYRFFPIYAPNPQCAAVGERIAGPLAPHPIADIICAWANGFRVEFRYRHHNPGIPEEIYLSDERWHLCGKAYSAWSGINEHRIHADDLAAWEAFKRAPATPAAEEDHDAWQCDRCNGDGWHWVEHEGVEWRDKVSTKEHCEQCDGLGWLGPDATKAAAAKKGKPPVQGSDS